MGEHGADRILPAVTLTDANDVSVERCAMTSETPVAFIVFNRPELTERVFARIAEQRPKHLLVIADGPRDGRPGEAQRCEAARAAATKVDWPCDLRTQFSKTNLGCRNRVVSGLDWVFLQYESAIILEDDCLPHPSFFAFCEQMLERYRDHPRVMHVTGNNLQPPGWTSPDSYYFSRIAHIWGWASWRRSWQTYDATLGDWPKLKKECWLEQLLADPAEAWFWTQRFDEVYANGHTWDYQWVFNLFRRQGAAITPAVNLITNIGFGPEATHTTADSPLANRPSYPLSVSRHPATQNVSDAEDRYVVDTYFLANQRHAAGSFRDRLRHALGRKLRRFGLLRSRRKVNL